MPLVQARNDLRVFLDEDHNVKDVTEDFIGRKAFSLFQLTDMDVPVPPFFVLSGSIFSEYISEALGADISAKTSDDEIRKKILKGSFPESTHTEIVDAYSRLSGFTHSWVSVRSSVILAPSHRGLAFAGMLDTVLNVKGPEDILSSIKKVYASTFSSKVAGYLAEHNLSIADIKVGVIVQKMVQSEAAGVVFTVDPISQNTDYLTIEAVFGLGDVIANGEITPDQYIIDKNSLEYIEKRIVPQEWMMVRKIQNKDGDGGEQKVKISRAWQHQQKLENRYVKNLAKIALDVEKKAKEPQDLEWVFEGGRIWLLQTASIKPVAVPETLADVPVKVDDNIVAAAQKIAEREAAKQAVKEELARKKSGADNEEVFTQKPLSRQVVKGRTEKKTKEKSVVHAPLPGEKLLITGIGASGKTYRGTIVIVQDKKSLKEQRKKFKEDAILVVPGHFPEIDRYIPKVKGLVCDTGGITSDVATMCRERDLPCIMGCHIASKMLKDGETVLLDGTIGAVYGKREPIASASSPPKSSQKQTTPKPKKSEAKPQKKHAPKTKKVTATTQTSVASPNVPEVPETETARTATKILADLSSVYEKGDAWKEEAKFRDGAVLQVEDIYAKMGRHPEAYIEDENRRELVSTLSSEMSETCELVEGNPVIVSIGSMDVNSYRKLTKGKTMENIADVNISGTTAGLTRLLNHPKEISAFFTSVRNTRNKEGWRTLSVAVRFASTPDQLAEFKKQLSSAKLRRSSTFNLYLELCSPSEALILEDFIDIGLDGIIINVPELAKHMMAPSNEDDSVIKTLETLKPKVKDLKTIVCVPDEAEKLLKTVIKLGYGAIAVEPKAKLPFRKTVSELEREAIFKK